METDTQHPLAEYGKEGANVHVRLRDVKMNVRAWMGGVDFFNASSSVRRRGRGWKKVQRREGDDTAEENPLLNQGVEGSEGGGVMQKKVNVCGTCGRRNVRAVLCSKVLFFQLWFLPRKSLWEKKEFFFRYVGLGQMGREITGGWLQKFYAFGMNGGGRRGKGRGENRSLSAAGGSAGGGGEGLEIHFAPHNPFSVRPRSTTKRASSVSHTCQ